MASSITVPQAPKRQAAAPQVATPPVTAPSSRRGPTFLIVTGVLVLVLIAVGVGGFFIVNRLRANLSDNSTGPAAGNKKTSSSGSTDGQAGSAKEIGRYWLEVAPASQGGQSARVAGFVPLASGQRFKFHFSSSEDGYLYIIGPGEENAPTAFVTAKPPAESGLQSNEVRKRVDFSFPKGKEHWLELDKNPGTENYTVIFSAAPLTSPQFLSEQATGKPLSATEQMEWTSFIARYKASAQATELNDGNAAEPFVAVKVSGATTAGEPVVLNVRIQHK